MRVDLYNRTFKHNQTNRKTLICIYQIYTAFHVLFFFTLPTNTVNNTDIIQSTT